MTGATIAALCAAGVPDTDPAVVAGANFLKSNLIAASGAFNSVYGANTDSNAWAVRGLNACGINPQTGGFLSSRGKTPIDYLIANQISGGGFIYQWGDTVYLDYTG